MFKLSPEHHVLCEACCGALQTSLWMPAILPLSTSAHAESLPGLVQINDGPLCCFPHPLSACAATVAMSFWFIK